VRDSEEVQVAGSPVNERGAPAQRERDGHEDRVGRVRGGREQRGGEEAARVERHGVEAIQEAVQCVLLGEAQGR